MTGGYEITTKDVYDEVKSVDAKLDLLTNQMTRVDARQNAADGKASDHESRIRALERFRFTIAGAAIGASALMSALGAFIDWALTHH